MDLGRMAGDCGPDRGPVNLWQARGTIGTVLANEPGTPIWHELVTPDVTRRRSTPRYWGELRPSR